MASDNMLEIILNVARSGCVQLGLCPDPRINLSVNDARMQRVAASSVLGLILNFTGCV